MTENNLKLGVDVVSAYNLKPKGGKGSTSAYVELFFNGQKYRTTVKDKDFSPVWEESFYFSISNPSILQNLNLEAHVYSTIRDGNNRSLLGKVSVSGTSFVRQSDAVVLQYPLKKCRLFSWVREKICLKVYITDDPSINSSTLHSSVDNLGNLMQMDMQPVTTRLSQVESEALLRTGAVKADVPPPEIVKVHSTSAAQPADISLKETQQYQDNRASTCNLVGRMDFLYVSVVKACNLPIVDITESLVPFVEVRVGNYKGVTKHINKNQEWNVVFAFSMDQMQASVLYVVVKYKNLDKDDSGIVRFDLNTVPLRVPPDCPLVPQWYHLENNMGERIESELMLAVWTGTQADEAYHDAWHFDAALPVINLSAPTCMQFRPMVYHPPTLWYVRVTIIEAKELQPTDRTWFPEVYVKARTGDSFLRTKTLQSRTLSPVWNEDLLFVVAEPFEDHLVLTVENDVSPGKDEILGSVTIPVRNFDSRVNHRSTPSRWYNLEKPIATELNQLESENFCSKIHLRLCLDGGYHVLDESAHYSSDLRPTVKELCKAAIGLLEVGILEADQLHPMKTRDGRETSDTYCVAKYGKKWIRTRTIIDSLCPKYNEQYSWEIFDRATVLTVGVFDNGQSEGKGSKGKEDVKIGKVEIRLSALETGRVYSHFYPLMDLQPTGVKMMGRLHLAMRFSCTSFASMLYQYSQPLLPKMHYVLPLTSREKEMLRYQAVAILVRKFAREKPGLCKEVVEYMSEVDSDLWSRRRSKANYFRVMSVLAELLQMSRWLRDVCMWRNPIITVIVMGFHVRYPFRILPMLFLYMFLIVVWSYHYKPKHPPHTGISTDETTSEPTSWSPELVRTRHGHLWSKPGRLGDKSFWTNPIIPFAVMGFLVSFPWLILPMLFLYLFLILVRNYRYKPKYPPHKDTRISNAETCAPDELDEELDTFPTSRSEELVRMRYDRLRGEVRRIQKAAGDVATRGERILALLTWQDPYATAMFGIFCLVAAVLLYVLPLGVVFVLSELYALRHPRFRSPLPALPSNFFSRLPDRTNFS